jgi:hypothetical protein
MKVSKEEDARMKRVADHHRVTLAELVRNLVAEAERKLKPETAKPSLASGPCPGCKRNLRARQQAEEDAVTHANLAGADALTVDDQDAAVAAAYAAIQRCSDCQCALSDEFAKETVKESASAA